MIKNNIKILLALGLLIVGAPVFSHNNVVVIPMGGEDKLANVIIVASQGGDFTDPVAALASIKDASPTKRYKVLIMPGIYNLASQLVMKPYVDIIGSGRDGATPGRLTKLSGSTSATSESTSAALVVGANNASIASLVLVNSVPTPTNTYCFTMAVENTSPTITDVEMSCTGAGQSSAGIWINNGSPEISHVRIDINDGGAQANYGIMNRGNSSPTIYFSRIQAYGGNLKGYGFFESGTGSGQTLIYNSDIVGKQYAVYEDSTDIAVSIYIYDSVLQYNDGFPDAFSGVVYDSNTTGIQSVFCDRSFSHNSTRPLHSSSCTEAFLVLNP